MRLLASPTWEDILTTTCSTCAQRYTCELLTRCLSKVPSAASQARVLGGGCNDWKEPAGELVQPVGWIPPHLREHPPENFKRKRPKRKPKASAAKNVIQ